MRKRLIITSGLLILAATIFAGEKPRPAPRALLPAGTLAVLEVPQPEKILSFLFDPGLVEAITQTDGFKQYKASGDYKQLVQVIRFLEMQLGVDWQTGLKKLLGDGITAAVLPGGAFVLMVDAADGQLLSKLSNTILTFSGNQASQPLASRDCQGTAIWTLKPDSHFAQLGSRLVFSNTSAGVEAMVKAHGQPPEGALVNAPHFQAAQKAAGSGQGATLYVDLQTLKQNPDIQQGLSKSTEPMQALFFAPIREALLQANWLMLSAQGSGRQLTIQARADHPGTAGDASLDFAHPGGSDQGASEGIQVPGLVAGMSLYRDLFKFYSNKDRLFPERTSSLIFFENMMGIFFSGRDLTDAVFAELKPDIQLVVAEQQYDAARGIPNPRLPAFALVFKLRHPDTFALVMEEAWQKAIGLINFTRGQQAQEGLIIDRPIHESIKFTTANFSRAAYAGQKTLPANFNFQPSLAVVKDYMIMSATDQLARDLIDALSKESDDSPRPVLAGQHSRLTLRAAPILALLEANRDNLIRQNMLEKGHDRQQAEKEIGTLLFLLGYFDEASLTMERQAALSTATLNIKVNLP